MNAVSSYSIRRKTFTRPTHTFKAKSKTLEILLHT